MSNQNGCNQSLILELCNWDFGGHKFDCHIMLKEMTCGSNGKTSGPLFISLFLAQVQIG
jgi:hypothetical protein